jgi:hypothetical protein
MLFSGTDERARHLRRGCAQYQFTFWNELPSAEARLGIVASMAIVRCSKLNKIFEEDAAPVSGTATFARILRRNGDEVFSCDVGPLESDCVIRLNTTAIHQGGPVRIDSFKLTMPQ